MLGIIEFVGDLLGNECLMLGIVHRTLVLILDLGLSRSQVLGGLLPVVLELALPLFELCSLSGHLLGRIGIFFLPGRDNAVG